MLNNIKGFAIIKKTSDSLYVDVICGAGVGKSIFDYVSKLALEFKLKKIELSSLPEALLVYYKSHGFTFGYDCKKSTKLNSLAEDAFEKYKNLQKQKRNLILSGKTINISKLDSKISKVTLSLERALAQLNFVHVKGCKTPKKCGTNGYSMTKCI